MNQRLLRVVVAVVSVPAAASAVGCAGARSGGQASSAPSKGISSASAKPKARIDPTARYQHLMSREGGTFPKHRLSLFGGLVTGEYEADVPSRTECTAADAEGDSSCEVRLGLGQDADGEPSEIRCAVDTVPRGPFGGMIASRLDGAGLMDLPKLTVAKTGDGMSVTFMANWMKSGQDTNIVGTLKLATFYSQGYSATCADGAPGGRQTFERVVGDFFRSLKLAPNPGRPAMMTMAYDLRQGDRSTGFRYGLIEKRMGKRPGSAEIDFAFRLDTDGKTWRTADRSLLALRSPSGKIELYRHAFSGPGGKTVAVLSAKPAEDGKFRLKIERGDKTDALEATPKAPLTTELWSAGEFAKVSRGVRPSYRYAILGLDDTGDPAFHYVAITRSSPGVLLEEDETSKKNAKDLDATLKDELHILDDGSVTKEVGATAISQRIYTWGKLSDAIGASDAQDRSSAKAPRAKVKGNAR
jgi:hypothetical protein